MSTYRVELKGQGGKFAVYQSTSESMYCPTFDSELEAEIFACYYGHRDWFDLPAFSERGQTDLASQIRRFLEEECPFGEFPWSWVGEQNDGAQYKPDADDVIAALDANRGTSRITLLGDFAEWRKRHSAAQIGGAA